MWCRAPTSAVPSFNQHISTTSTTTWASKSTKHQKRRGRKQMFLCSQHVNPASCLPHSPTGCPAHISPELTHGSGKARIILTRWTPKPNVSFGYSGDTKVMFPGTLVRCVFNFFEDWAIKLREQSHWPILISLPLQTSLNSLFLLLPQH